MASAEPETTENVTDQQHEERDEDDEELHSSHKIVPDTTGSQISLRKEQQNVDDTQAKINDSNNLNFNAQNLLKQDAKNFLNTIIPKDYSDFVHGYIKRDNRGIQRGFEPMFSFYINNENEDNPIHVLSARKQHTLGHIQYFINTDHETLLKNANDENSIAKLRGITLIGADYVLYDYTNHGSNQQLKHELAAISYESHIGGSAGPRKFRVLIPTDGKSIQQSKENQTIFDQWRSGLPNNWIELKNHAPKFDEGTKKHVLTFEGNRIQQSSHKNFQLISENENHEQNVVMQFGRIDENNFALDYRYPLSALQAFAIALSSFHNRFRT